MRSLAAATILLTLSLPAGAICVRSTDYSEEDALRQAKTIFVATITKAYLDPDYQERATSHKKARGRPWYTVRYEYAVAIEIKGEPASVPFLLTAGVYNDPTETSYGVFGEQSRFVPGDNILVVANGPGPAPISWSSFCTDSRPWDGEARALLKRAGLALAP